MRSAWLKTVLVVFSFCLCLTAQAQTNPHTQIRWPPNCGDNNYMTYNYLLNSCVHIGPIGNTGDVQLNQAGAWATAAGLNYNFGTNTLSIPNLNVPGTAAINLPPSQLAWPSNCAAPGAVYNAQNNACFVAVTGPNVNPGTQVTWPAACSQPGYVYSFQSNSCISAAGTAANPAGAFGQLQYNNAGIFGSVSGSNVDSLGNVALAGVGAGALSVNGQTVFSDTAYNGLFVAGDSFSSCLGVASQANCWDALSSAYFAGTYTNVAAAGSSAQDGAALQVINKTNPTYINNGPLYAIEFSGNDVDCGVTTGCEANYSHSAQAIASWLGIPNEHKILFGTNTTAVTTTGTWTQDSTLQSNLALQTIVPGSTLTFTTLSGGPLLYLAWMANNGNTASASLNCNGGALTDTLNAFGFNGAALRILGTNTIGTVFANRYYLAAGITSCTVTVNTAASGSPFSLVFAGAPVSPPDSMANVTISAPRVKFFGMAYNTGFARPDASLAAYDVVLYNLVTQWRADGIFVTYMPMRTPNPSGQPGYLQQFNDFGSSPLTLPNGVVCAASTAAGHPNDCGHRHLRDAFLNYTKPVKIPVNALVLPSSPANADQFATINPSTFLGPNTIWPGLDIVGSSTLPGQAIGTTVSNVTGVGYTIDNFTKSSVQGWRWCVYPAGTALVTPSQYTACYTLPLPLTMNDKIPILPSAPANVDQFFSVNPSGAAPVNAFAPGINLNTTAGNSFGMAMANTGGTYYIDSFGKTAGFTGWRWCTYTGGTPLSNPASYLGCALLPKAISGNVQVVTTTNANGMTQGVATLVAGTATVGTTLACNPGAACVYELTRCAPNASTAIGSLSIGTIVTGASGSFVINALTATNTVASGDLSTVCWAIH